MNLLIKPASGSCNMQCKYCFYADVANHRESKNCGMMTYDTLEKTVKSALEYADRSCSFAFQGGEPTLAGLDFYRKLIELQKKHNKKGIVINNSIQTNGYIMDEEWARFFAENNFLVGLSLDGPKEIHDLFRIDARGKGTYSRVMQTVRLFEKYRIEYNILCVVNNIVARHGQKVYNFFKQNGFKYIQFIPCLDPFENNTPDIYSLSAKRFEDFLCATFDLYYSDIKKGEYISIRTFDNYVRMLMGNPPETCGMTGTCSCCFVMESNGNVYPCDFYVIDRYYMGNISDMGFHTLLQSESVRRFVTESYPIDQSCENCKWFQICRGGCRRYREPFENGIPKRNLYCSAYAGFFDYSMPRLKEIAAMIKHF